MYIYIYIYIYILLLYICLQMPLTYIDFYFKEKLEERSEIYEQNSPFGNESPTRPL